MTKQAEPLRLGTRGSKLAMTQSQWVADRITEATGREVVLVEVSTRGDRDQKSALAAIGGKGLFTAELEEGLREGSLDFAVHSLKDLPTEDPPGLILGAIPVREDPRDALVGSFGPQAHVGTGSLRRRLQIQMAHPNITVSDIRGNVDTRLRKLDEGQYDAIILAMAGVRRLGIERADLRALEVDEMVPAVGQGALAVQCRDGDGEVLEHLAAIHHEETARCVAVERTFLATYGGGCNVPAACHAVVQGQQIFARAVVENPNGEMALAAFSGDGPDLGRQLAVALM